MAASKADHGQLILDIETNMLEVHAPVAIISYDGQATMREGGSRITPSSKLGERYSLSRLAWVPMLDGNGQATFDPQHLIAKKCSERAS